MYLGHSPPSPRSRNPSDQRREVLEKLKRKELQSSSSDSEAAASANYVKVLKHRKSDDVTRNDPHDVIRGDDPEESRKKKKKKPAPKKE